MLSIPVTEIFFSIQGEGNRVGTANIFIRLQGCQTKHACYALGVRCDTEFESGKEMSLEQISEYISKFNCPNIIWTGGEPADRITEEVVDYFKGTGYYQAIETSGLFSVASNLDYVSLSPKVAEHVIAKNFTHVSELRYVRHAGQSIPNPSITADYYYISPHSDGNRINKENLVHCINLVKENPKWRLSVQSHKLWQVL